MSLDNILYQIWYSHTERARYTGTGFQVVQASALLQPKCTAELVVTKPRGIPPDNTNLPPFVGEDVGGVGHTHIWTPYEHISIFLLQNLQIITLFAA